MASPTTKYAKRKSRAIYVKLDSVLADMLDLSGVYAADHPDLSAAIEACAHGVLLAQDLWVAFYERCWGSIPSDWSGEV